MFDEPLAPAGSEPDEIPFLSIQQSVRQAGPMNIVPNRAGSPLHEGDELIARDSSSFLDKAEDLALTVTTSLRRNPARAQCNPPDTIDFLTQRHVCRARRDLAAERQAWPAATHNIIRTDDA